MDTLEYFSQRGKRESLAWVKCQANEYSYLAPAGVVHEIPTVEYLVNVRIG